MVQWKELGGRLRGVWKDTQRQKSLNFNILDTPLNRCLTALDLTLLAIGNMAGAGLYIITGPVVRRKAGPATCLAYLLAGFTALLNGFCYAEMGARVPKAGSAYTYIYVTGGELVAFVVGWSVILEYVLSAASAARGFSGTLDLLLNHAITNATQLTGFHSSSWMALTPDFVAAFLIILVALIIAFGPKASVNVNTVVTAVNMFVVILATAMMYFGANIHNWNLQPGGFAPMGVTGVIAGAATCFFSFLGFDIVSLSSEEAADPARSLPKSIIASVLVLIVLLFLVSSSLTLYVPWNHILMMAPIPGAFAQHAIIWAVYVTGIGSLVGIFSATFCSMYGLPRVVYAMANDGLIFRWLGAIFQRTKVPLLALIIFTIPTMLLALLVDLEVLADFLSVGTLIAYSIVSFNILILRYSDHRIPSTLIIKDESEEYDLEDETSPLGVKSNSTAALYTSEQSVEDTSNMQLKEKNTEEESYKAPIKSAFSSMAIFSDMSSWEPFRAVHMSLWSLVIHTILLSVILIHGKQVFPTAVVGLIGSILSVGLLFTLMVLYAHEQNIKFDTYKVPFVPFLPTACLLLNIVLILHLSKWTWVRFFSWLVLGLIIYFTYGLRNSSEKRNEEERKAANESDSTDFLTKYESVPGRNSPGSASVMTTDTYVQQDITEDNK